MELGRLIEVLEAQPQDKKTKYGFHKPHSYRGYYEQLAFEPKAGETTVAEMLAAAKSALGKTFTGWKGGAYKMTSDTKCWISFEGESTNDNGQITEMGLAFILGGTPFPDRECYHCGGTGKLAWGAR